MKSNIIIDKYCITDNKTWVISFGNIFKVFFIHILNHSAEMTFNHLSHVFNAVHCFTSLGCLMSLEDGTHMDILPKIEMTRVQKQGAHQSLGHKKPSNSADP